MMKKYHTGEVPMVLIDHNRKSMMATLRNLSNEELEKTLNQYRTNTQVSALMTKSGSIYHVPFNAKSKYADQPFNMSLFNAWNEMYKSAKEELACRLPSMSV